MKDVERRKNCAMLKRLIRMGCCESFDKVNEVLENKLKNHRKKKSNNDLK